LRSKPFESLLKFCLHTNFKLNIVKLHRRFLCLTLLGVLLFNSHPSFSQFKFGPKLGLYFTKLPNDTKFILEQKIHTGYIVGTVVESRLFNNLYIQPGIFISNRGSGYKVGNKKGGIVSGFTNYRFSVFYTDITANFLYKIDLHSYKLFLTAGPHLGYGISGKWTAFDETKSYIRFGTNPTDDYKPFDYGINIGGGLQFGRFQISSQYYLGLHTISPLNPPLVEQKYKALDISITYLFVNEKKKYAAMDCRYLYIKKHKTHRKYFR
jgi:hypothetical protein